MAITVDNLAAALAAAQRLYLQKTTTAAKSAGAFQSCWLAAGNPGAGSAAPAYTAGSGYTCSSATNGAIVNYANSAGGGLVNRIGRAQASAAIAGKLILADRLWSCSGMGFAAGTYTVTTPGSLPARITDNGKGCRLFVENFVASGAATGTLTANYLDSNTGAAQAGVLNPVVSAPVAGQMQSVPLATGSEGLQQLTSVVTSATWTSGTFGMSIVKVIAAIPINPGTYSTVMDYAQLALAKIPNDACVQMAWQAMSSAAITLVGEAVVIDGTFTTVDSMVAELGA